MQNELDNSVDVYIINEVKKYTSDQEYAQLDAITNSQMSDDMKLKKLTELFRNYGITDVREGVQYLRHTTSHRASCLYLTTNEIFCAYNWAAWLNSPQARIQRGLLYADGLIFNGEIFDYLDLESVSEADFPGVKKNKEMLKQFLGYNAPECQIMTQINRTTKYFNNLIKLNNLEDEAELDELMSKIMNSTSEKELEKWQKQFADMIVREVKENQTDKIYKICVEGDQFAKALGYAASVLEFAGATVDDILALMNLSNEIALYEQYSDFLTTVYQSKDISFEMRYAAYSLLDEINNGYWNKVHNLLTNCFLFETGMLTMTLDFNMWEHYLGEQGILFGDALATLSLATFVSNIVVDAGDFVKQAAYTQGYAELAVLYSWKLLDDKEAFQKSETAENAWKFFEDYSMLWSLRYCGEEQYLNMNQIKMFLFGKVKACDYEIKESVVKDTLAHLEKCRFNMPDKYTIPDSVQYSKKAVVHCPVDVEVYTQDGKLVTSLKDGAESDIENEYGRFAVVYQPYSDDYAKVVCQTGEHELKLKIKAVSDGLVDYEMASRDEQKIYAFDNVYLEKNGTIETSTDIAVENGYVIDETGNGDSVVMKPFIVEAATTYISVDEIQTDVSHIELNCGETKNIGVRIVPENATFTDVAWYSDDENVATVDGGLVKAVGIGSTIIYAKAVDGADVISEITVNVEGNIADKNENDNAEGKRDVLHKKGEQFKDTTSNAVYKVTKTAAKNGRGGTLAYKAPLNKKASSVRIPKTVTRDGVIYKVTSVAANAFKSSKTIKSVTIGANVTSIGKNAFYGCKKLKNVTIGSGVQKIGAKAFCNCISLKKVMIPAKTTLIGKQAFYKCKKIKTITVKTIKLTKKTVGADAFKGISAKATVKVSVKAYSRYKKLLPKLGLNKKVKIERL